MATPVLDKLVYALLAAEERGCEEAIVRSYIAKHKDELKSEIYGGLLEYPEFREMLAEIIAVHTEELSKASAK